MPRTPNGRELTTVTTAFDVLDYIKEQECVAMGDVLDEFDMAKSTAHGYVSTLEKSGLIVKREGRYVLGLKLLHLGENAKRRNSLFPLTKSTVGELADILGEAVDFIVEDRGRSISIYNDVVNIEDPNFQVGMYFYMHNCAGGKAMLAEFSDEEIQNVIDEWGLPGVTKKTITDPDELFDEIESVRRQGFATTDDEIVEGFRSVGTAVTYPNGDLFGALGVGGPKYRINDRRFTSNIPDVLIEKTDELEDEIADSIGQQGGILDGISSVDSEL
jgi:DNA-binding IclR family transcriptional regulator